MVNRVLGVSVLGLIAAQFVLMMRDVLWTPGYAEVIPGWRTALLGGAMIAIGVGAVRLVRTGERSSTATWIGLGLLWTMLLTDFLVAG